MCDWSTKKFEHLKENGLDYCVCRTFILEYYEKKLGNFRGEFEKICCILPSSQFLLKIVISNSYRGE